MEGYPTAEALLQSNIAHELIFATVLSQAVETVGQSSNPGPPNPAPHM